MSSRARVLAFSVLSVVSAWSARASAAPCENVTGGRSAFEAGARLFEAGKAAEAAPKFEEAFTLACKPAAIFNAALAWEAAGDALRAARAFDQALALGLPDDKKQDAEARRSAAAAKVGTVEARGTAGARVTIADQKGLSVPARVRVEPGRVRVYATFPDGTTFEDRVSVAAGETRTVDLAPAPAPAAPPPEPDSTFPSVALGVTALAISGALAGATIGLGVSALSARDDFLLDRTDVELHDQAATLRTWTNVTLTGSIAFALLGTGLLVIPALAADAPGGTTVSLRVAPDGLGLVGAF